MSNRHNIDNEYSYTAKLQNNADVELFCVGREDVTFKDREVIIRGLTHEDLGRLQTIARNLHITRRKL